MFKKKLSEKRTKEQAFASLVSAGILTKKVIIPNHIGILAGS